MAHRLKKVQKGKNTLAYFASCNKKKVIKYLCIVNGLKLFSSSSIKMQNKLEWLYNILHANLMQLVTQPSQSV
jgi:hypothetical protein